jgi:hypothetical protein
MWQQIKQWFLESFTEMGEAGEWTVDWVNGDTD